MSRFFSLRQAESLLAMLEPAVRRAITLKTAFQEADEQLDGIAKRISALGGARVNQEEALSLRNRRDSAGSRLKDCIEEIQTTGCQIKDLDIGLLDFPTLYRGEEVLLCWKLGEEGIRFWHNLTEGFRGRRPIDEDFCRNHAGDPE
ncbi:MAG: DUF2203 family protein [Bryobacteraceae bacterium]|nr:DUF2203 family protein [Bryobacteraceae bacterium]